MSRRRQHRYPIADELETPFMHELIADARKLGWHAYHTHDSRKSDKGFPDVVFVRERVVWVETKSETGALTPEQAVWIDKLARAGQEVYVWRPSDRAEIDRVLATRGRPK